MGEKALVAFTEFFLGVCLDQVRFMESLVQPKALLERMLRWAEEEMGDGRLPPQAPRALEAMRSARNVTTGLSKEKIIASAGPRMCQRPAKPGQAIGHHLTLLSMKAATVFSLTRPMAVS